MEMYVLCLVLALVGSAAVLRLRIKERRRYELLSSAFIRRYGELISLLLNKYECLNIDEANPEAVALAGTHKRRQTLFHIALDDQELLVSWYFRTPSSGEHCLVWVFDANGSQSGIFEKIEGDIRALREELIIGRSSGRKTFFSGVKPGV